MYLEIGDRTPGGGVVYPDDDVQLAIVDGKGRFTHKDGTPYQRPMNQDIQIQLGESAS